MVRRNKHKVLSPEEQLARGASAISRTQQPSQSNSQDAAPNQAQSYSRASAQSTPQAFDAEQAQGANRVSLSDARNPEHYHQMQQKRDAKRGILKRFQSKQDTKQPNYAYKANGTYQADRAKNSLANAGNTLRGFDVRRTLKAVGITLAALAVAFIAFVFIVAAQLNSGITSETRAELSFALPGKPYYMLLVGTDKSEERVEAGSRVYRTDSIILARVDPIAAKLTLISIQRDTQVDLGEYGTQKINAAYAFGGAPLLISAVSDLAGVPISHYAEIDFDSFVSVVDALGGIEVNVPIDIDDDLAEVHLSAGEQTLTGAEALGLCRARHAYDSYGSGDYYRTSNQRMVLGAILKKGLSGNPLHLVSLIGAVSTSVTSDVSGFDILFLGLRFIGFDMSTNLMSGLEPTVSSYENGVWYELVDEDAWSTMMSRVKNGLSPYASEADDPTAGVAGIT